MQGVKNRINLSFDSENLVVDWISFNIQGLADSDSIGYGLSNHFKLHVFIDGKHVKCYGLEKEYNVFIRQYTGSKGYWVGT